MTTRRLLLLDAASLYYRAFYGVPDRRRDPQAPPNNAIRGLLDMTASLITRFDPSHLVMCWDDDWRPAFRVEAIPTYKAHRVATADPVTGPGAQSGAGTTGASWTSGASGVSGTGSEDTPPDLAPQVPAIIDVLAAVGIARVGAPGYEADDVIGSLAARYHGHLPIDVVTGDRDLFQLVDDSAPIRVVYTARGGVRDADVVDQAYLAAKYAVPTGRAYAEMATLRGDTSDGLPGVPGIGEKTAAALIAQFGSLDALRAAVDDGDPRLKGARRARLEAAADYLDVAPRVVDVATNVPLDVTPADLALPTAVADERALADLVERLDIDASATRLLTALTLR